MIKSRRNRIPPAFYAITLSARGLALLIDAFYNFHDHFPAAAALVAYIELFADFFEIGYTRFSGEILNFTSGAVAAGACLILS